MSKIKSLFSNIIFKIIILVIDFLTVAYLIVLFVNYQNKQESYKNIDKVENENVFKYRNFIFDVPNGMKMNASNDFDYKFEIKSVYYYALIEIYKDSNGHIINNPDLMYNEILNNGINVSKPAHIKVNEEDLITFNIDNSDKDKIILYKSIEPYVFFIQMFGYNDNTVNDMLSIFHTARLNNDEKYFYRYYDFSEELKEKKQYS